MPVASPVDFATFGDYTVTSPSSGPPGRFRGRVTADGSSGWRAEPGRYHLYVSLACPWAHRSIIVRGLKGLEDVVGMTVLDPVRDGRGWAFRDGPGHTADPVNDFALLRDAYEATEPGYDGHVSVPVLWDRETGRIVSSNYPDVTLDLGGAFDAWATPLDLYPEPLRPDIDALNERIYTTLNKGVYRCGLVRSQAAYDRAVATVFGTLDELERRLATRRFLFGDQLTEADVRLYVTLARFDAVYGPHQRANLRRLADYPTLWAYTRDLYEIPAFGGSTDLDHIRRHYYRTQSALNPSRIVPAGPVPDFTAPHGRGPRFVPGGGVR
ncbi:glutathione-dependent reductase [Longispora fulva]|uniref:Putative glutathione S-transferase n=1 Tax=Longispora fulva TaxID=619741 RepID=A0A8J7GB87_9ACTN|nr:glutathione S-transferase C-terminal domain-containing protein [Longispora fulva]MBG6137223.1 putative glutathione S-transferase [Longispora fulva]GIG61423.1 glutathione-dependent reductase [Longispora fulva]